MDGDGGPLDLFSIVITSPIKRRPSSSPWESAAITALISFSQPAFAYSMT